MDKEALKEKYGVAQWATEDDNGYVLRCGEFLRDLKRIEKTARLVLVSKIDSKEAGEFDLTFWVLNGAGVPVVQYEVTTFRRGTIDWDSADVGLIFPNEGDN